MAGSGSTLTELIQALLEQAFPRSSASRRETGISRLLYLVCSLFIICMFDILASLFPSPSLLFPFIFFLFVFAMTHFHLIIARLILPLSKIVDGRAAVAQGSKQ